MIESSIERLSELQSLLERLNQKDFTRPVKILFNATIGQHVRHIVEFYLCLLDGIPTNEVSYDHRKRDTVLESDSKRAWHLTYQIKLRLLEIRNNKMMTLIHDTMGADKEPATIVSSLYRELVYCMEHCLHHQALIKVGLHDLGLLSFVGENFGVASSTILNREWLNNN